MRKWPTSSKPMSYRKITLLVWLRPQYCKSLPRGRTKMRNKAVVDYKVCTL